MSESLPSLVLFDLDGVLVDYDRAARVRHLARALGHDDSVVQAVLFDSGLEDRFDAGLLDTDAYLDALGASLQVTIDRPLWAAARGAAMRVDPALPALLHALSSRCTIAMLTNNGGLLGDVLPGLFPALAAPFGGRLLCSGQLGVRKPDPRVFELALRQLGHAAERTLFFDDVQANVDGARRAGLRAARVDHPAGLPAVLGSFGLV